jgi:hypothetical protein
MTGKNPSKVSPTEALAELVVSKLEAKGLVNQSKHAELVSRIVTGTATQEDWKMWIDLSREQKGDKDGAA